MISVLAGVMMPNVHEANIFKKVSLSLVGKSYANQANSPRSSTPAVGARFTQSSAHAPVWVVQSVMNVKSSQFPLVRLTSEKYPDLLKVVSLSALYDDEEFTPA